MAKRLISINAATGISTWHDYDPNTGKTYITNTQDVESILELNQRRAADESFKQKGLKNEMLHVASIPLNLVHKWLVEDGIDVFNKDHTKALLRKLNDPDYKHLKTVSNFHL